jgi:uncharacterized protein (DUF2132 family)
MHAAGPKNPLHGITLEKMLIQLEAHYGWEMLGQMIKINCFNFHPSIKSSLVFLRRTPWARAKVEELYLDSMPDMQPKTKPASGAVQGDDLDIGLTETGGDLTHEFLQKEDLQTRFSVGQGDEPGAGNDETLDRVEGDDIGGAR